MDNEARKSALMDGLFTELLNLLVHYDIPGQFEDLVKLLQGLDSRYRLNNSRNQGFQISRSQNSFNRPYRPIFRDRERYFNSRAISNPSIAPQLPPGEPMDLGAFTRQRLSAEKLNRRIKNNLCRYCRESEHFVKDCPKSASSLTRRPNSGQSQNRNYRLNSSQQKFERNSNLPTSDLPASDLPASLKNENFLF
jgi:hypothetical protein